ncbi:MAG: hypothetical protein GQ564_00510, partial [Bacteroidales bacterium]|nr:hypothetical protein [Bacteroidales bacterium]
MKTIERIAVLLFFSTCLINFANAQDQSIIELQVKDKDNIPSFIIFKEAGKSYKKGQEKDVFKEYLKLTGNDDLKKVRTNKDELEFTHEKYHQFYKGIKVEFAEYNVHLKDGKIESINGDFKRIGKIDLTPEISEEVALQKALDYIGASEYMWEIKEMEEWIKQEENNPNATYYPKADIVIVNNQYGDGEMRLAFKLDIDAYKPFSKNCVYVDANTGIIINNQPMVMDFVETNNADTRYSGPRQIDTHYENGAYVLRDYTRGDGIEVYNVKNYWPSLYKEDFVDNDNNWTSNEWDNPEMDNAALDALWAAQKTYDYFWEKHGRNSYDNNGALIKLYVHYDTDYIASWAGDGDIYLGDGDYRYWPLTAIDGVAHEIGHGICKESANLYFGGCKESAALHEALSDIWGACVEHYAAPEKNEWLTGEEVNKLSFCTRSLSNPNSKGDPDTYEGNYWYTGAVVSEYMHRNNGVINYWFYLLSEGGTDTNDNGDYYNVTGIGIEDASKIVYRMETSDYLTITASFYLARFAALKSAKDKFGFNSTQVIQTGRAWHAVGVGDFDFIPTVTDSQIRGGSDNVPYYSANSFFITPASDTLTSSYVWSIIPYTMGCISFTLPRFIGSNTGT